MDPKTEIIIARNNEIEALLSEWGFIPDSPQRDQKKSQIKLWLSNFRPSQINDAILILSKIQYKDEHMIRGAITQLAKEIKNIFQDNLSFIKFFPLGESPSSSGGMYLYDYKKELSLSEDNFPYNDFRSNLANTKAFVFFDDIIGSGKQATKFANRNLKNLGIKSYYVVLFAFEAGLRKVKKEACFEEVICGAILSDEERAFHDCSQVFTDANLREKLKILCESYGKRLFPRHPLGYDDSQALLSFPHNTPNNTLPIIWASTENEKAAVDYPWYPIFERKKKKRVPQEIRTLFSDSNLKPRYDLDLIGREDDVSILKSFLLDTDRHFFLLWGVGGMGKTHLFSHTLAKVNKKFIYHTCNKEFTLKKLFRICGIKNISDSTSTENKTQVFIEEFIRNNIHLILDDYYEVLDQEVRTIVAQMIHIHRGKLLVISRAIPRELNSISCTFPKHRLPPLGRDSYFKLLDDYAVWKNLSLHISDENKEKIYRKTLGYPLAGHLIVRLLAARANLDQILNNLVEFVEEIDPGGREFIGVLLGVIFEKENREEIELLCQFSAFTESVGIDGVRILPSYNLLTLENIIRKDLIWLVEEEKLSTHPLVREFAYNRLKNKVQVHKRIAGYYESFVHLYGLDDIDRFEKALQHNSAAGSDEVLSFNSRMYSLFRGKGVKELIDTNTYSTIKRLKHGISLSPDYLPFYNELGIAYRIIKKPNKAIEVLNRALEIEPEDVLIRNELGITYRENKELKKAIEVLNRALEIEPENVLIRNELGITYRENKELKKAIEVLSRALEIEPENVLIRNELGITYRENKELKKAIEVLNRALEIEPMHLPSHNELGITYRENNLIDEAVSILIKGLKVEPTNSFISKSILELYVFFNPEKAKAQHYFDLSTKLQISKKSLGIKKRIYKEFIDSLDEIVSASCDDLNLYERYIFHAIRLKALHSVLPLLFALNKKYPNNPRIISRLGKTLANPVINRAEEAIPFIIEAIDLYKQRMDKDQTIDHIIYYLRGLLYAEQLDLLKEKLEKYTPDLMGISKYHRFLARYFTYLKKPENEIMNQFQIAIEKAVTPDEYETSIKAYIYFLEYESNEDHLDIIDSLRNKLK